MYVERYNKKNILDEGKRIIGLSSPDFKPVENSTMNDKREISLKSSGSVKQEKNDFYILL